METHLKNYSAGEEIANSVTHAVGILLAIAALGILIACASIYGNAWHIVSVSVYGATLVLLYTAFNLPYVVWMMRGYILDIPLELEESALVDGCTPARAFFSIVLPLAAPGVFTSAATNMGSTTRARAMATRCCCPPDSSWGKRNIKVEAGTKPTTVSIWTTRSSRSATLPMPCTANGSATVSKIVRRGFRDS